MFLGFSGFLFQWHRKILIAGLCLLIAIPVFLNLAEENTKAGLQTMSQESLREVSGKSLVDLTETTGNTSWTYNWTTTTTSTTTTMSKAWWSGTNTNTMTMTFTMTMTNTPSNNDITFSRIETDSLLELEGGLNNARVGFYNDSGEYGCTGDGPSFYSECNNEQGNSSPDFNISDLEIFGRSGQGTMIEIEDPFVDLAFRNHGDPNNRQLVGMRLGAERVNGQFRFILNQISGSIRADCVGLASLACGNIDENEHRTTNGLLDLAQSFGFTPRLRFKNTKDFWISFQREDIIWKKNNPAVTGTPGENTGDLQWHTDGRGFWMHFSDSAEGDGI